MSDERAPRTRSYRSGDWFGIFGANATVVLPPSQKRRVAALWELLDDGVGFDEALDALISKGLRDLPGFLLVSQVDDETKVVLRGEARVTFTANGNVVRLEGSTETTWVERSLRGVTQMVVRVAESDDLVDRPIEDGLVRLSRFDQPAYASPRTGTTETEEVVLPQAGPAGEASGELLVLPETEAMSTPAHRTAPVARLSFSSGEVVDVDRVVLVGRSPDAQRATSNDEQHVVRVPSPQQEISGTHLEIRPGAGDDHGSAVAVDLGSTNGTQVVQPGRSSEALPTGTPVLLHPGAVLDLGDGLTIKVSSP